MRYHPSYRVRVYSGGSLEEIERGPLGMPILCVVQAYLGRKAEVSDILGKYVVNRPRIGMVEDETRDRVDTLSLEAAVLVGHRQAAEQPALFEFYYSLS